MKAMRNFIFPVDFPITLDSTMLSCSAVVLMTSEAPRSIADQELGENLLNSHRVYVSSAGRHTNVTDLRQELLKSPNP